ncbi:LamG domain-containing protein (plasmid) [Streptomyces sp. NBC_01023]|uniref:LamG-like jellyroll fold domain-containing protein n=1 Tax=unclassified Streptomyces TaxID=2593676 RepID=UPI002F911FB7|nr:LamG domain-containing protein [Streptomyces sp. NBC_01023]
MAVTIGLLPLTPVETEAAVPARAPGSVSAVDTPPDIATRTTEQALAAAKRSGEPVEIPSMRGESSDVYATADGNLEAREYLRPVRTRIGGEWKPVDTNLTTTPDGVKAKATASELAFSAGGQQPLVRMEKNGRELALSWPRPLPKPEIDGATATYRDVLPGVDLRMGAQEDGFTQLLVVKSAEAARSEDLTSLRLKLTADGMDVRRTEQGSLEAVDQGAGGAVFEAPTPQMWDSSAGPDSASATAKSTRVRSAVAQSEPGAGESGKLAPVDVAVPADGHELVLTPDQDVLRGKDTQYPVFIDPQWYSPRASSWTMASKYWASSPQWKFNGAADAGMGLCDWSYCQPHDTKRLFYQIPVSKFAGKSILSAEFVVRNTWSASCEKRGVELWQTKGISASTTWNSQSASGFWIKQLKSDSFAYGYTGCAAKDAEFDVRSAVQSAATSKTSSMTFGLRAASEADGLAWKRFSDKAYLRVKFNRPPAQVKSSQLTMEYGGVCKKSALAAPVRTLGKIYANNITDPDGDSVAVQFQVSWDSGDGKGNSPHWTPARTPSKKSGSAFTVALPSSIPTNKKISWQVRVWDGAQYSPWSSTGDPEACYFIYDTKVPKAPGLASGDYPALDPENPQDPWYDGVGKYGTFAVSAADTDVSSYWYGINTDPTAKNKISTSKGAAQNVRMLPSKPGLNFVTAQAFDSAGNGSEIRTYLFRVKAGQPERATWQLDEQDGASEARGSTPDRDAILHGGAAPGAPGETGTGVAFDGVDDYADTDIPVVATDTGFSVSAWAKLSSLPQGAAIIAAQPGNHSPGFELYYSKAYDRWAFNQYTSDTPNAPIARAMQASAGGVKAEQWTHLVGTYSSATGQLSLYVQGQLAGSTTYDSPWDARRGLQIGAGSYDGKPGSFFPGTIDDLRVFDKPLTAADITHLYRHEPLTTPGRQARAIFLLDEPANATHVTGHADVDAMSLKGGARSGRPGVNGRSLTLDGSDDYATTVSPQLNNERGFAVSAWVKLPEKKPDHAAMVVTQAGAHTAGFELYYSSAYDRWAFNQYSADEPDATPIRAMQAEGVTAHGGDWVHLVGVHDTVADKLTLYVNGAQAGSTNLSKTWYAAGPVQIGAGSFESKPRSFLPGQIDDVRLYDRPVSAEEVAQMFKQHPLLQGRWQFEEATSTTPATSPDASEENRPMTLKGGAALGTGWIDDHGLQLNGNDAYASTASMPVDTSTSFTVTAWAQAAATPSKEVTVLSAESAGRSALDIHFVPEPKGGEGVGRWEMSLADKDSPDASEALVSSTAFDDVTSWNHLAVVYDGFSKEARLFVNGVLQEVACGDDDGDGTSDDAACADLIAWGENVLTHKATRGFQVGANVTAGKSSRFFPGTVDDVWAFQGALSDSQVEYLAASWFAVPTEVPPID